MVFLIGYAVSLGRMVKKWPSVSLIPIGAEICSVFTTTGCKDSWISSSSKPAIREAWIAAPLQFNSLGFGSLESIAGAWISVDSGKIKDRVLATFGMLEVPPTNKTASMSRFSKPAFLIRDSMNSIISEKTFLPTNSNLNLLIEDI